MKLLRRAARPQFRVESGRRLNWYACLYDSPTVIREDGTVYTERIVSGAFDSFLAGDGNVTANIDHDDTFKFAQRTDGSLLLQTDPKGLFCSCWVPEGELGDEVIRRAMSGEMGASFRFHPVESREADGVVERVSVLLADVCITDHPAYPDTIGEVHVRTQEEDKNKRRAAYLLLKAELIRTRHKWVKK
jgi:HK97 family phage prohead protease